MIAFTMTLTKLVSGWQYVVAVPSHETAFQRWVCGRTVFYHGRVEVSGRLVSGFPTIYVTPNRDVHVDTLITVFAALRDSHDVWELLPDGRRVTHIFGPNRSNKIA